MSRIESDLESRCARLLGRHLEAGDERTLHDAYELGREALAEGVGILDLAMTPDTSDDYKFKMEELRRSLAPLNEGKENPLRVWWEGPAPSGEPAKEFKAL